MAFAHESFERCGYTLQITRLRQTFIRSYVHTFIRSHDVEQVFSSRRFLAPACRLFAECESVKCELAVDPECVD
jgi:hypothetical protein